VNSELEMVENEVVVAYRTLKRLRRGAQRNLSQDSRYPSRDLNPGLSEYETGLLATLPRFWHLCRAEKICMPSFVIL
jgi:hypothetical protein